METPLNKFILKLRNLRAKCVFDALKKYCHGSVLDVGGGYFYLYVKENQKINFEKWTNLEYGGDRLPHINDSRYESTVGDGCAMTFADNSFDTVVNIQVLEHVYEPIKMVQEIQRVLKPNGYAIFLIPQTASQHQIPQHYYNFTRYWIKKVMEKSNLEIVEFKTIGGNWSTHASQMMYFFFSSLRFPGYSSKEFKRNALFYIMFPFMACYASIGILIGMIFSIGDLKENPNNHLMVARKRAGNM